MKQAKIFIAKSGNRCVLTWENRGIRTFAHGRWDRPASIEEMDEADRWTAKQFPNEANEEAEVISGVVLDEQERASVRETFLAEGDVSRWARKKNQGPVEST